MVLPHIPHTGAGMLKFTLSRLGLLIPTFLGVTLIAFFFIRLIPGDPVELLVGERGISPERHAELLRQIGLREHLPRSQIEGDDQLFQPAVGLLRKARAGRRLLSLQTL